MQQSVML